MPDIVLFNGERVKRVEIVNYFNEYYYSAVRIYNDYHRYGLPWSGGYMETPNYLKTIYDIFETVSGEYRTWIAKKKRSG